MQLTSHQLSSNDRLIIIQTKKFKTVTLSVRFNQPLDATKSAARALLHRILTGATAKYPSLRQLANSRNDLYGLSIQMPSRGRGYRQMTTLTCSTINGNYVNQPHLLHDLLQFAYDIIYNPFLVEGAFPLAYFQERQRSYLKQLQSSYDDKSTFAAVQLYQLVAPNEPLAINIQGTEAAIQAVTLGDVMDAYRELIRTPKVITVVGDIDPTTIENHLREWPIASSQDDISPIAPLTSRDHVAKIEEFPFQQSVVTSLYSIDAPFDSDKEIHAVLMNAIFGGTALSKLFKVVREEHNYCYSIHSSFAASYSMMEVSAEIASKNYEHVMELINQQLVDLQNGVFTDEDLSMTRNLLVNSIRRGYDYPEGIINFTEGQEVRKVPFTLETYEKTLLKVTRDDVIAIAKTVKLNTHYFLKATSEVQDENA